MKSIMAVLAMATLIAGCATGQHLRTTVVNKDGTKTVYETKQTGYWFTSGKPQALQPDPDSLELPVDKQ